MAAKFYKHHFILYIKMTSKSLSVQLTGQTQYYIIYFCRLPKFCIISLCHTYSCLPVCCLNQCTPQMCLKGIVFVLCTLIIVHLLTLSQPSTSPYDLGHSKDNILFLLLSVRQLLDQLAQDKMFSTFCTKHLLNSKPRSEMFSSLRQNKLVASVVNGCHA